MKQYLTSIVVREMQIEATITYLFISIQLAKIKKAKKHQLLKMLHLHIFITSDSS